jgi:hypothetical protein
VINKDYARGARAAAELAAAHPTTHPNRLDDCILAKMNLRTRIRKNRKRLQTPEHAFLTGVALALAEIHRLLIGGNDSSGVCEVANNIGLTLRSAKEAGVAPYDIRELKRAGVK